MDPKGIFKINTVMHYKYNLLQHIHAYEKRNLYTNSITELTSLLKDNNRV